MTAPVLDTPTGVLVGYFSPGSEEWLAARADGLGGSEIAAVMGLSPFESRFSLWHRKAGRVGPVAESEEMEWGKRLEDAVCQKFADQHPEFAAERCGTYRHVDRPWQVGNPDRLLYRPCGCGLHRGGSTSVAACCDPSDCGPCCEDCPTCPTLRHRPLEVFEAKTSIYGDGWGEPGTDQIPVYVRCQTIWYCDTLGLRRAHVAVLIGGHDYREYTLDLGTVEESEIALLRDGGEEFLATVHAGQRPDIDAHPQTYQVIREMHPQIDHVDVDLDDQLARDYCTARQALKAAEQTEQLARSKVADHLGNGHRARFLDQTIATRQARGDGVPYLVAARGLPTFTEQEQP